MLTEDQLQRGCPATGIILTCNQCNLKVSFIRHIHHVDRETGDLDKYVVTIEIAMIRMNSRGQIWHIVCHVTVTAVSFTHSQKVADRMTDGYNDETSSCVILQSNCEILAQASKAIICDNKTCWEKSHSRLPSMIVNNMKIVVISMTDHDGH